VENQKFLVSQTPPAIPVLLQKRLEFLPSIQEPSKSASTPKTSESTCQLAPIVGPTRKPVVLKLPVDVRPEALLESAQSLVPKP
jgi:hypothetical protein